LVEYFRRQTNVVVYELVRAATCMANPWVLDFMLNYLCHFY